ncbi:MAG: DsrE family protein [Candidatus Bathyarchaeota archaeon]|jgi:hypothetical protein|nr:DsrE family protein [Candidatus Bathyarchaeota archaeon]
MLIEESLVVVWTSGEKDVAMNMVFMYVLNAKLRNWWKDLRLIIWGPSVLLASNDPDIQTEIARMLEAGVRLEACKACADRYEVSNRLQNLGIEVKYMGVPLTQYIQEGRHVISF